MGEFMTVHVHRRGHNSVTRTFHQTEVTIGRVRENDARLNEAGVDERHARIVLRDGKLIVVDLRSEGGTFINGRRIASPVVVTPKDWIQIGGARLRVSNLEMDSEVEAEENGRVGEQPTAVHAADAQSTDSLLSALDRLLD